MGVGGPGVLGQSVQPVVALASKHPAEGADHPKPRNGGKFCQIKKAMRDGNTKYQVLQVTKLP